MTVCVEEHQDTQGLTVRMASNAGDLQLVNDAFTRLATVLERAAVKG